MKIQKLFAVVASAAQAPSALAFRCFVGVKYANVSPRLVCRYVALGNTLCGRNFNWCQTYRWRWFNCVKGKRDGPAFLSSTVTATLWTDCAKGLRGKKNGNGTNGYCCYSDANCEESCINGKCSKAKVTLKPATTSLPLPICTPGFKGK